MAMDVAIIGAGIFGLAAGWACAEAGHRVRIYDATAPGAGSSGGIVGALSPHMPESWNPKKAFQFKSLLSAEPFWEQIAAISGLPTGYGHVGRWMPLHSEKSLNMAQARSDAATKLWQGKASFSIVPDVDGITASHGVVHETLSARLYPALAVRALATALQKRGVTITAPHAVADPAALDADSVVVAAGHACPNMLPDLAPMLRGVKGQAAMLDHTMPDGTPLLFEDGLYIIGHGAHGTAIGSTSENTWTDGAPDNQLDALIARAAHVMPALGSARVTQRWSGIRPRSVLPDPVLGPVSDRVWLFTGGFKIGFGIAHELASALALEISGSPADLPETFRLSHHLSRL